MLPIPSFSGWLSKLASVINVELATLSWSSNRSGCKIVKPFCEPKAIFPSLIPNFEPQVNSLVASPSVGPYCDNLMVLGSSLRIPW